MPRWPTRASGSRSRNPSTIPSPARSTGTIATSPSSRFPFAGSSGVSTVTSRVGRSRVASIARIADASSSARRNSPCEVARSRRTTSRAASTGCSTTVSRSGMAAVLAGRRPRRECRPPVGCRRHGPPAAQRRAQGPRPRPGALAGALRRAGRRGPRRAAPARHILRRAQRTPEAARAGAGRGRAHRLRAGRRRGGAREPVPDRAGARAAGAARGARRRARHRRRRRQAPAPVPVGGRPNPPRPRRGTRRVRRARGRRGGRLGPRARGAPRRAPAGRARDRRRRDRGGVVLGPAARLRRRGRRRGRAPPGGRGRHGERARAVLALPGRRGAAHARRRDPRRGERRERRLPAGSVRGGVGHRGDGRGRGDRDRRGRGHRRAARDLPALRRLPPAPRGVRAAGDARPPRAAGRPAPHRHARRAAAARLRPGGARVRPHRGSPHNDAADPAPQRAGGAGVAEQAADALVDRQGRSPRVGIVLGSGLGAVADAVADAETIDYADLPGFPAPTVRGRAGGGVAGALAGVVVAVRQGRRHLYEGPPYEPVATPVRALRAAGVDTLILTNAAGSLRPEVGPGRLMAISDHINRTGQTPLAGPTDDALGPRFPSLRDAYDPELRATLHATAGDLGIDLAEGVYLAVTGPSFETPAEIRAFAALGADAVGMSTVHETIVARHAGLRVAAISTITNLAEGLSDEPLSHEQTLHDAQRAASALARLLEAFVERMTPR